jgi:hypothetical protein
MMNSEPMSTPRKTDALSYVRDGMKVIDASGKLVGRVTGLYMGAAGDTAEQAGVVPETTAGTAPVDADRGLAADFVNTIDTDNLPDTLRNRLRYNGYVQIDSGVLHRDRFALREQVASVAGDEVRLNVAEAELIKA